MGLAHPTGLGIEKEVTMKKPLVLLAAFVTVSISIVFFPTFSYAGEKGVDQNCYMNCIRYIDSSTCTERCDPDVVKNRKLNDSGQRKENVIILYQPTPYNLCFDACMAKKDEYLECSSSCSRLLWQK
ncbi:MAG TPA: hypothetical protein VFF54_08275 [Thermodesulfobacteriota bacterium]|nr:hypothetical protein [Thermodesulfobacteriota bacterium]